MGLNIGGFTIITPSTWSLLMMYYTQVLHFLVFIFLVNCTYNLMLNDIQSNVLREFQLMTSVFDDALYHQTKTPIDFWCRQ